MSLVKNHTNTITAAEYKSINVPSGIKTLRGFTIKTEDESPFWMSHDGGTTEDYYPTGCFGIVFPNTITIGDTTVEMCKVKGTTSTNLSGVIV